MGRNLSEWKFSMSNIQPKSSFSWDWFDAVLHDKAPALANALNPPATQEQIQAAEAIMGIKLPLFVRKAYLRHDGSQPESRFFLPYFSWCSLDRMVRDWRDMQSMAADEIEQRPENFPKKSEAWWRDLKVRPVWWHPSRIPIGYTNTSDHLFLDMKPGPAGVAGQMIADDGMMSPSVKATGLEQYLDTFGKMLADGRALCDSNGECFDQNGQHLRSVLTPPSLAVHTR